MDLKRHFSDNSTIYNDIIIATEHITGYDNKLLCIKNILKRLIIVGLDHQYTIPFQKLISYLINEECMDLQEYYSVLFDNTDTITDYTLTKEEQDKYIKMYESTTTVQIPKYNTGQLVGIKDKDNNWWIGEILLAIQHDSHVIYYVKYCQMGSSYNEFITDTKRIETFNPKKHRLYEN